MKLPDLYLNYLEHGFLFSFKKTEFETKFGTILLKDKLKAAFIVQSIRRLGCFK